MRKLIAVIGDAFIEDNSDKAKLAFEVGKALVDNGYRVQSGGLHGVMEAAFKGAHASTCYREGDTIGIIPSFNAADANDYTDIAIPTGLDIYRNVIVANASAVVAIGGGAGTMCEMTNAWACKKLIIGYSNVDGWSAKVADTRLDNRVRYENIPEDKVFGVKNANEVIEILKKYLSEYNGYNKGIPLKN